MNFIKNNLANGFTLANLFFGSIAAINLVIGHYEISAVCIIVSLILDFFDGFVARALKANSNLGVQLDSLADMVSFGFVPGLVMYKALEPFGNLAFGIEFPFEVKYFGLLVTLFSCLRLAIFNLDEEQKYYFKGLNTPSNTILLLGMYYCFMEDKTFAFLFENSGWLILVSIVCSWLLVSPVKMIANKFKSFKLQDNYPKIAVVMGAIILISIFKTAGIPLSIVLYIFISLLFQRQMK